jgi:two-component system sensor histidine kinase KdpD
MLARAAAEAERARLGKLKIFFGMAPGVGKTYALLQEAQARRAAGVDVVLGWVETHGRRETEALTAGLERLAPRHVDYRGLELLEFDLDAALARRPALVLLDELAHTNAAGSRHARRWQDVDELLGAGIDVYTTLNVQHVESLNDVVAGITGVVVRETVPDSIVDRAHEIELIDLTPDELLQRLKEGKVYVPAQAERALANFFEKGNLLALRELALRRTAERVDAQGLEWRRQQGVAEPWGTRERVLVAVGPAPSSADVIRAAYRLATRLRAPWLAVSVETPAFERLDAVERERVSENLALAQGLGAETLVVRGTRASDELLALARERNATKILIGKPGPARWPWQRLRGLVPELVARSGSIDVLVTSGEHGDERAARGMPARLTHEPKNYAWALLAVIVSSLLCWAGSPWFSLADQAMLYLLGVLIVASRLPRRPSLFAAVASVAALEFFFVPPQLTFAVSDLRYIVTFAVMLAVALLVSTFTVRLREQAEEARQRERRTASLYAMGRQFVIETGVAEIARVAVGHVRDLLGVEAIVLLADRRGNLTPCGGADFELARDEQELAVARWAFQHGRLAGHGTDTLPGAEALFVPLVGSAGHLGAFGIALGRRAEPPTPSQWQILETFVAQTALALERALLVERAASARVVAETERTRSALLSAVSHDVRTPLASIAGAASALLGEGLDGAGRRELLETIREESERLSRLIGDLLDLTRLESGDLRVRKEPYPLEEIVDSAVQRLEKELAGRRIERVQPEDVLLAPVDPILLEQVLVNLLENAGKYTPAGSPIEVRIASADDAAVLEVADRGPGLPKGEEARVFERFYRAADSHRSRGTGLGLTVCQAIVQAHGGRIEAENRIGGGALFRVRLPLDEEPNSPGKETA